MGHLNTLLFLLNNSFQNQRDGECKGNYGADGSQEQLDNLKNIKVKGWYLRGWEGHGLISENL